MNQSDGIFRDVSALFAGVEDIQALLVGALRTAISLIYVRSIVMLTKNDFYLHNVKWLHCLNRQISSYNRLKYVNNIVDEQTAYQY